MLFSTYKRKHPVLADNDLTIQLLNEQQRIRHKFKETDHIM